MSKSVVGYVRVSTTGQVEDGCSLPLQEQKIKAYADLNDLELVEIIADKGISGKSIKKRAGIQRVLELVKEGAVQGVIIYKLDRMARNLKEACEISELLNQHGCQLHSICEKIDTTTASGRLFYHLLNAMALWEADIIAERTSQALQGKKGRGERVGQVPYGWTVAEDEVHLVEEPAEQKVIRSMLRYRQQGMNINQIAKRLTDRGVPTRTNGGVWHYQQVKTILKRVG